jgi:hypothetical protein
MPASSPIDRLLPGRDSQVAGSSAMVVSTTPSLAPKEFLAGSASMFWGSDTDLGKVCPQPLRLVVDLPRVLEISPKVRGG